MTTKQYNAALLLVVAAVLWVVPRVASAGTETGEPYTVIDPIFDGDRCYTPQGVVIECWRLGADADPIYGLTIQQDNNTDDSTVGGVAPAPDPVAPEITELPYTGPGEWVAAILAGLGLIAVGAAMIAIIVINNQERP